MKRKLMDGFQFPHGAMLLFFLLPLIGCGGESSKTSLHDDEHEVPAHSPLSLADLGKKIRARVAVLEKTPDDSVVVSELNDLISWSAEIAADTNITEKRWMPIYELSEKIRASIEDDAQNWQTQRFDQAIKLCQLTDDAWQSLPPDQRRERLLDHGHDHDHGHGHGDHGHDHGDHDDHGNHDDHGHDHGDHDDHGNHDDHGHDHGDHHDHGHDHGNHDSDHDHGHDHDHGDHDSDHDHGHHHDDHGDHDDDHVSKEQGE